MSKVSSPSKSASSTTTTSRPSKAASSAPKASSSSSAAKASTSPISTPKTDRVTISSEVGQKPASVHAGLMAGLQELAGQDHAEWGGQTTTPGGQPIKAGAQETDPGRVEKVGEYWNDVGMNWDGNTDQPWSSAYMSSLHERAGVTNFDSSIRHGTYINSAIEAEKNNDPDAAYHGQRVGDRAPEVGDLVCWTRGNTSANYDDQRGGKYSSHCDLVVGSGENSITTLGGNVGNSVSTRQFSVDDNGLLNDPSKNFIAVLEPNNLIGG